MGDRNGDGVSGLYSDWDIQLDLAERVLDRCRAQGLKLATAESCTGGLVAGCITAIAGSSEVFTRGLVTYDDAAKIDLLGVDAALFNNVGAVSEEVARAMAEGALAHPGVDIAVADTGIAGPGGATALKPVGRVHLACARTRPRHPPHPARLRRHRPPPGANCGRPRTPSSYCSINSTRCRRRK